MVTAMSGQAQDLPNRWPLHVLTALAFLAPFNVKITTDAWTDLQFRILVVVALIAVCVLAVRSLRLPQWHLPDRIDALAYGWLVMIWVSTLASNNLTLGAGGAVRLSVVILLVPATRSFVRSNADAAIVLRALGVGTALGACLGLGIWLWGADLDPTSVFVGKVTSLGPFNRLTRPWSHANVAAMAMGATAAATVLLPKHWMRMLASTVVVVAIVLTISRGGLVAMGAVAVAWLVLRRRVEDLQVIIGLAVVAVVVFVTSSAWGARVEQLGDQAFYASAIDVPATVAVGGSDDMVEVTITNLSATTWSRTGEDRVLISARWIGGDGLIWTEDRWQLPHDLDPGESVTTGLTIGPRVPDGAYDLRWDLLVVDTAYFGQFLGDDPIWSSATVSGSSYGPDDNFRYDFVQRNIGIDRIDTWRLAWGEFASSPFIGIGPNQFGDRLAFELADEGQRAGAHAHNIVLEPLAAWGLFGTIPFLMLGIGALGRAVRRAWANRTMVASVIAAGLIAVVVHGMVDWPLVVVTTGIPVGLLVGLAWADLE